MAFFRFVLSVKLFRLTTKLLAGVKVGFMGFMGIVVNK